MDPIPEFSPDPEAGRDVAQLNRDVSLFLPGVVGRKNFQPTYELASAAIREVDDQVWYSHPLRGWTLTKLEGPALNQAYYPTVVLWSC